MELKCIHSVSEIITYQLQKHSSIKIGRHELCEIRLYDVFVSKIHCRVYCFEERVLAVMDGSIFGSSKNGTWINGKLINDFKLLDNLDIIQFAKDKEYPKIIYNYNSNFYDPKTE